MTQREQEIYHIVYDFLKDRKKKEFVLPYLKGDELDDVEYEYEWSEYELELRTWSKDLYNGCAETVSIHRMFINEETNDVRFDLMYIFWDSDGCFCEEDNYICEEGLTFEEIKDKLYDIESLADVVEWVEEVEESKDE